MRELTTSDHTTFERDTRNEWGIRVVENVNTQVLRLFFLSLLWRSANTSLDEFDNIEIRNSDNRRLKRMIIEKDVLPFERFAMSMHQISTLAPSHNQAPYADVVKTPLGSKMKFERRPIFRFFLDGLIVHISREPVEESYFKECGQLMLCRERQSIGLSTKPWGLSNQYDMVNTSKDEAEFLFPGLGNKISKIKRRK